MHASEDRKDGWSAEQDATIIDMRARGIAWKVIGEYVGRTDQACSNRYRVILPSDQRHRINKGIRWTQEEENRILILIDEGRKPRVIAALMGKELTVIYSKIQQMRQPGRGINIEMEPRVAVPPDVLIDRDRRMAFEPDLTSLLCGDPRPGQSALDKKQGAFV